MGLLSLLKRKKITPAPISHRQKSGPVIIGVIGPPASGKATQAKLLAKRLHFSQVNIGQMMARASRENTPLGRRLARLVRAGSLISAHTMKPFLLEILDQYNGRGVVLDGFPRTVDQARLLVGRATQIRRIVIVELELSEQIVFDRVKQRQLLSQAAVTNDEKLDVVDDKYLLYNTSKRVIEKALCRHMDALQVSYVKIDGNRPVADVHQDIVRYVEKDLEDPKEGTPV